MTSSPEVHDPYLAQEILHSVRATSTLIQKLDDDVSRTQISLETLKTEYRAVSKTVESLSTLIRDGTGSREPIMTSLALLKDHQAQLEKAFATHADDEASHVTALRQELHSGLEKVKLEFRDAIDLLRKEIREREEVRLAELKQREQARAAVVTTRLSGRYGLIAAIISGLLGLIAGILAILYK